VFQTVRAIIRGGKIELLEQFALPEGSELLITVLVEEDEDRWWLGASESALAEVWDNAEDDVYAELLER